MKVISFNAEETRIEVTGDFIVNFSELHYVLINLKQLRHSRNLNVGRFCLNNLVY
jgi:hypothetical protein